MNDHRLVKHAVGVARFFLGIGIIFAAGSARADGEGNANQVEGTLASTQVVGDACHSPLGLCTSGTLTGGLAGTFFYTADSLVVLPDGITGVFDGTIVLQTKHGIITEHDHTTANLQTGQLVDVITILSGTDHWAGATGTLNLVGSFDFATGVGASTYTGTVYLPE